MNAILAVGPRELPPGGMVMVWMDSGNTTGHEFLVPVEELHVAELDDGQGTSAIYTLRVRECRG
ncbi:hypothetical protein [Actinoplanes sp. NPDC051411]|uniref:hypothetical protein n=1 Tax=Actinoplanes sp. NPDC051411 TaxID=3155522 RepID=UPI00343334CA